MNFDEIMATITPETYQSLIRAVELGKWQNGTRLTEEQRAYCMQAVIAWGERNLPANQRVGFIDRGSKEEGEVCEDSHHLEDEQMIKFLQ